MEPSCTRHRDFDCNFEVRLTGDMDGSFDRSDLIYISLSSADFIFVSQPSITGLVAGNFLGCFYDSEHTTTTMTTLLSSSRYVRETENKEGSSNLFLKSFRWIVRHPLEWFYDEISSRTVKRWVIYVHIE